MKQYALYLIFFALMPVAMACTPAATVEPAPIPIQTQPPTVTALPPAMQALLAERDIVAHELFGTLERAQGNDFPQEQIDNIVRSYVPTIEAIQQELTANGVQVPPIPLPPTPEITAKIEEFDIGMVTEDDVRIMGTYYRPASNRAPGVVLLHMLGRQRQDWQAWAQSLQQAGFGVLTIDLRGHGQSQGERDWQKMTLDTAIAVDFLRSRPEIDPQRIVLTGASIGANVALNAAAQDKEIAGVALLSAGLNYHGIKTEAALQNYGQRPLFLAASNEDSYAAQSARQLDSQAPGPHQLLILENQGHGTDMLGKQNELEEALMQWFSQFN